MTDGVVKVSELLMPDRVSARWFAEVFEHAHVPDDMDALGLDPGALALDVYGLLSPYQGFERPSLADIEPLDPRFGSTELSYAAAKGLREAVDRRLDTDAARYRFRIVAAHNRSTHTDVAARYAHQRFDDLICLVRAIDARLEPASSAIVDAARGRAERDPASLLAAYLVWHASARYASPS